MVQYYVDHGYNALDLDSQGLFVTSYHATVYQLWRAPLDLRMHSLAFGCHQAKRSDSQSVPLTDVQVSLLWWF